MMAPSSSSLLLPSPFHLSRTAPVKSMASFQSRNPSPIPITPHSAKANFLNSLISCKKNSTMVQVMNEDMDEVLDDLFEKYGKVVFRSRDQKPASKEADDDAESLSFAVALAKVASDVKASDIRLLFVKPLVYWTHFFLIATAFSRPQIDAISSRMRDAAEKEFGKFASGDRKPNSWTLLDFGDVVVHVFLPQQRAFYNLEEFYGNATSIKLPFDTQSSTHN